MLVMVADKKLLREQMRALRLAVSQEERRLAEEKLALIFAQKNNFPEHKIIAGYAAHDSELNLWNLLENLARDGKIIALPIVAKKGAPLEFRQWQLDDKLQKNIYGILEPRADSVAIIPDMILLPGLAFDRKNFRLGYGGGFYDITLAALKNDGRKPLTIGLGYELQRVETVFPEEHDQALDQILLL
jgi:5-formyltetrahydrofolate cyclo-ligase